MDKNSTNFNLKWTKKKADLNFGVLQGNQYVNHFQNNTSITTKSGLCRNLRNLIWSHKEDIDKFYPRCFDLNDLHEFDDFIEDFMFSEAEKVLKCSMSDGKIAKHSASELLKVLVALYICERRCKGVDETIERLV